MAKGLSEEEIKREIASFVDKYNSNKDNSSVKSEEFSQFEREITPSTFSLYEKACNFCDNIVKINIAKATSDKLTEDLETCGINTTPNGITVFSILFPVVFMMLGILASFAFTLLFMRGEGMMFFIAVFVILGISMILPLTNFPSLLAGSWRLKASNQMVLTIFYIVSYMRHTSNLELAIKFTSDHIVGPLSIDLKKIIWNVETSKYSSIQESLDAYLQKWKPYTPEFVESMHLVQSSLYEPSEKKRLDSLEKALSLILEATFEKMLHYAQDLKSPITMLHMLGVILPILGLVILPLVVSFMDGVKWYHISVIYNLFFPLLVWYMGTVILSTRPTGYGQADITEVNPELKRYALMGIKFGKEEKLVDPKWISVVMIFVILLLGLSPLLIHAFTVSEYKGEDGSTKFHVFDYIVPKKGSEFKIEEINDPAKQLNAKFSLLGYKVENPVIDGVKYTVLNGPYGLGATLISVIAPFGVAFGLSFYFKQRTKKLVDIRDKTKELESEFASALFQLGNRIGDGLPAEIAFEKVAEITQNSVSGKFFELVTTNISTLGMGVEDAIFDKKYGAINKYPSALIESSMKVFVEGIKKGPDVASEALINISTYIKEMHKVDERLKDLMSEISGSMRSQINFLAPVIAGVVIGLTSMITTILTQLGNQINTLSTGAGGQNNIAGLTQIFGKTTIPTFYFQLVVGFYVVQITYILTTMLNVIENGYDPLNEKSMLGQNLFKSSSLYSTVAFIVILLFNMIAGAVLTGVVAGG